MFVNRWQIALIVYSIVIGLLVYFKPAMMFTLDGRIKTWSVEKTEETSLFSPMITFPILALLCYYLGIWIEMVLAD